MLQGDAERWVSIHAPRAEGDAEAGSGDFGRQGFNPRPPRGGRRASGSPSTARSRCFNPRPPRGGRPDRLHGHADVIRVSIHAPRAEGDGSGGEYVGLESVSIHAPRAEGDLVAIQARPEELEVSIHAPRAEGDPLAGISMASSTGFNPRPPRGGRLAASPMRPLCELFQSTPPARRATQVAERLFKPYRVSIHAPRAEGDPPPRFGPLAFRGFNPRPPRGGRRQGQPREGLENQFQSTPPARRATRIVKDDNATARVSIHAPRAEGDSPPPAAACRSSSFNPRPPRGGRLGAKTLPTIMFWFQSTPPARRATFGYLDPPVFVQVSIHAPRAEGDSGTSSGRR